MPTEASLLRHLPEIVYSILFLACLFSPPRWAIAAFLVLSTVDIESSGQGLGPMNLTKGLLLPAYLLWRLRRYRTQIVAGWPLGLAAWCGLTLYAAIAGLWSLFPLASLKLFGHMVSMLLIAACLTKAAHSGFLNARAVLPVATGLLCLALLRGALLPAYADEPQRFTSFTTAQSTAALIAALYAIALSSSALGPVVRSLTCTLLAGALVFNGSRIWFIGIVIATVVQLFSARVSTWIRICAVGTMLIAACLLVLEFDSIIRLLENGARSNRIASAMAALYRGDTTAAGLGTMNFRRKIDALAIDRLEHSPITQLVFGHGTCNGAVITGSLFHGYAQYTDPNRMFHNEWLRTVYEWGLVGFALWLIFIEQVVAFALRGAKGPWRDYAMPLVAYLPGFLLALGVENILAGAGNAASMGFLMLLGLASVSKQSGQAEASEPEEEAADEWYREAATGY